MQKFDLNKTIHVFFSGIGGISMSGLATLLLNKGFKVSGSDPKRTDLTVKLEQEGAKIFHGQHPDNISDDIDLVVHTAAVKRESPELKKAEKMNIPILTRAEFLGMLMNNYRVSIGVAGTHGKTSTTGIVSDILINAQKDPTISVGGIMPSTNTNFKMGSMDFFVMEACEYTNSFLSFFPDIAVILNCELDHTDFFKDIDDMRSSFKKFANNIKDGGKLIVGADIEACDYFRNTHSKFVTFGIDKGDYQAKNIMIVDKKYISFDLYVYDNYIEKVELNSVGRYNVLNALAAIAVAMESFIDLDIILYTLRRITFVKRRFEFVGDLKGVSVYTDFAHHPSALTLAINSARVLEPEKLWVVFQPHAYSRTKDFLKEFADSLSKADAVILVPIYAAREINTYGVYSSDIEKLLKEMNVECYNAQSFSEAEDLVLTLAKPRDLVMAVGGGDIDELAKDLVGIGYAHN